jgi:dTDP-4-dehydrorhamnose 3,5-epimerase
MENISQFSSTAILDVILIEPKSIQMRRGFFWKVIKTAFSRSRIPFEFVQDNHSKSHQGILRGLHYQIETTAGKTYT